MIKRTCDIRQLASLVVGDFVLSPLQLNQEAIDGIGDLLNHDNIGIRKIKATINKKLELIGILPNIVEPTPFQRDPSEPHVKRLMTVIEKVGRFLDPVVLVHHDGGYWTPKGSL